MLTKLVLLLRNAAGIVTLPLIVLYLFAVGFTFDTQALKTFASALSPIPFTFIVAIMIFGVERLAYWLSKPLYRAARKK